MGTHGTDMPKIGSVFSDFELLILFVRELKKFSYRELQDTVGRVQIKHKLFQIYFDNCGDIEGVDPPESMQLSFHFKVLCQLGYVQRVGTEYISPKKYDEDRVKRQNTTSKVIREMLASVF